MIATTAPIRHLSAWLPYLEDKRPSQTDRSARCATINLSPTPYFPTLVSNSFTPPRDYNSDGAPLLPICQHTCALSTHRKQDAGILIYGTNPETGGLALQKWISTSIVVYSLTYDAAYDVFYATPLDNRQSVIQLGNNVISRPMFGDDTQVALLLGNDPITDIHYSANTGTIFVLCAGCNTILEVMLTPPLKPNPQSDWLTHESRRVL
jgi:hypothetical protein